MKFISVQLSCMNKLCPHIGSKTKDPNDRSFNLINSYVNAIKIVFACSWAYSELIINLQGQFIDQEIVPIKSINN